MAALFVAIIICAITASIAFIVYMRKDRIAAEERMSRKDKILCAILAVPVPLAFLLLLPCHDGVPVIVRAIITMAFIAIEAFAVVSAFRLTRLARSPVRIVGITAFVFHALFLGLVILSRIVIRV